PRRRGHGPRAVHGSAHRHRRRPRVRARPWYPGHPRPQPLRDRARRRPPRDGHHRRATTGDRGERLRRIGRRRHPDPRRGHAPRAAGRRSGARDRGAVGIRPRSRRRARRRGRPHAHRSRAAVPALARCRAAGAAEAGERMTLRAATSDDLAAIMELERRGFPDDAWSEQTMSAEIAGAHNVYLVDVEGDRIVGYGGVRALEGGADADIQTIALDAQFRGRGRGRALLRALAGEAVGRGARELFLEVRADNPVAQALYVSEGFTELGRRPRYYQPG